MDPNQTPPQQTGQPPSDGTPPPENLPDGSPNTAGLTVEEVENQWRHRVSQKDRAHAAAEQTLRDENDALKRQMAALSAPRAQSNGQSGTQGGGNGDNAEAQALREQLASNQRALEEERRQRTLDARRAKYPSLAANVGDAGMDIFATSDEATLARLNAQLDDGSSGKGTFAPTNPRRSQPVPAKSLNEMTKPELEQELKRRIEGGALKR